MSATLAGNVDLWGCGQKNLIIRFFTPNTQTEIVKYVRATDASGNFTIAGITPGTYDVGVKCDSSLSLLAEDKVFTEGNTTNISFGTLLEGDLNGDDWVTAFDYNKLMLVALYKGGCYGYAGNWLMPDWPTGGGGEQSFVSVI